MKTRNKKINLRCIQCLKELVLFSCMVAGFASHSQENPWKSEKSTNPWGIQDTLSIAKNQTNTNQNPDTVIIISQRAKESNAIGSINSTKEEAAYLISKDNLNQSKVTELDAVHFENGNTVYLNRRSGYYISTLEKCSESNYPGTTSFLASFASSFVFNVFSAPVNLIAGSLPSSKQRAVEAQYAAEHPESNIMERNAVKRGINKKKIKSTAGGTATGIFASTFMWLTIAISNF